MSLAWSINRLIGLLRDALSNELGHVGIVVYALGQGALRILKICISAHLAERLTGMTHDISAMPDHPLQQPPCHGRNTYLNNSGRYQEAITMKASIMDLIMAF